MILPRSFQIVYRIQILLSCILKIQVRTHTQDMAAHMVVLISNMGATPTYIVRMDTDIAPSRIDPPRGGPCVP